MLFMGRTPSVRLNVIRSFAEKDGIVLHFSDTLIASLTEQSANLASFVAVVNRKRLWLPVTGTCILPATDGAFAALRHKHFSILVQTDPKLPLEIKILPISVI